jgi:hypothetical protein
MDHQRYLQALAGISRGGVSAVHEILHSLEPKKWRSGEFDHDRITGNDNATRQNNGHHTSLPDDFAARRF